MRAMHAIDRRAIGRHLAAGSLLVSMAFGLSSAAQAADRDWIRYSDFLKKTYLDRFYAAPLAARDALVAKVTIRFDLPDKAAPVEIKVPTATGVIVLRPDGDGVTEFPYSDALLQADPMVMTSAPAGIKGSANINLQPGLPLKETYSVGEVARPIAQANALIRTQAGMFGFVVPKLKRFVLRFPPSSGASVTAGAATLRPDKAGMVFLPVDDALQKADPSIVCSQRPIGLDVDT